MGGKVFPGAGSRRSDLAMHHRAGVYLKHQAHAYFWRRPQGALTHPLINGTHGGEWAGLLQRQTGSGLTSDTTAELWWDAEQVIQTALHVHAHARAHACMWSINKHRKEMMEVEAWEG